MPKGDGAAVLAQANRTQGPAEKRPGAERGLDWLNLFVANIQTGFGPFIAVYLTTQGWTQTAIGLALSIGTVTAMASQLPAGALVDAIARKSRVGLASILAFTVSALLFALWPAPLSVYVAEVLHGFSSCTLGPVVVSLSLALVGQAEIGSRLGRNARFASIGNGIGAALLGACGYYFAERSVFFLTAVLTLPALAAMMTLSRLDGPVPIARPNRTASGDTARLSKVLADRRLLIFALSAMLFTLADAAMLPLAATALTRRAGGESSLFIAACIVLPQLVIALLSPSVGRMAQRHGRRLALLLGFAALPLRGLLFAVTRDPILMTLVQLLDGIAAASFGVMVPLVTSDLAGRTRHFNLALGVVGFSIGIGGTFSTTLAGAIADRFGDPAAFIGLAAIGLVATLFLWGAMPETHPEAAGPAA